MKTRYPLLLSMIFFLSLLSSVTPTSPVAGYAPVIHPQLSLVDALSLTEDGVYMENGGPFDDDRQASGLLLSGTTTRVSVASDGTEGNDASFYSSISPDGRYVAFDSLAYNLVPGDTNDYLDVFVYDRQTGETRRVSVASDGTQTDAGHSYDPSISVNGRYVAFNSEASDLVFGDTNGYHDIFVHDLQTGETSCVSVASNGTQAISGPSYYAAISANGRYVAFASVARNLIPNDTNDAQDIFVHDRQTGETGRVSVASGGAQANNYSDRPSISADGRYVAFFSEATNLVPADTNGRSDVFVHDRQTGQTSRVSVASEGTEATGHSYYASISADGRYVVFASVASNLVPNDTNGAIDVFVHDRQTGETSCVSVASDGTQANDTSSRPPSISADGRYVAFYSKADNLVPNDTNGVGDVFVHDRQTGETSRVSVASDGTQSNAGFSDEPTPSISTNGRNVAFSSSASNLVPGDTNGWADIFVHARDGAINFYLPLILR
jgi:Tol biopolymer transport system component